MNASHSLPPQGYVITNVPNINYVGGTRAPPNATEHPNYFAGASGFVVNNPVMVSNKNYQYVDEDRHLSLLVSEVVASAVHNASARNPLPRCHPGTRVTIIQRLQEWALTPAARGKNFLWLKGPAGIGKTSIVQSIAEFLFDRKTSAASFFFSGSDSTKKRSSTCQLFTTIAYQLQIYSPAYRKYILRELAKDPKLLERTTETQFQQFIVKPFVEMGLFPGQKPSIVLLDGVDECNDEWEQCELIQLISSFVTKHPDAPLLWLLSSRPDSQLEGTFARPDILPSYITMEVQINSEAIADVKRYLRDEFERIRLEIQTRPPFRELPQWPEKAQFDTVARAANGLFAYASTLIRFIDGKATPGTWLPKQRLGRIVQVINSHNLNPGEKNPFAALDALYSFIMSTIPEEILPVTKQVLGFMIGPWTKEETRYDAVVNLLGISRDDVDSSLYKLSAVLRPFNNDDECLQRTLHKSFDDFLKDATRSGPYHISSQVESDMKLQIIHRIVHETLRDGVGMNIKNIRLTISDKENSKDPYAAKVEMLRDSFQYLVYEKHYESNAHFQIFDMFARACDFSQLIGLDVDPTLQYELVGHLATILLEIKQRNPGIDHIQEPPIGALDIRRVDISKPALLYNVGINPSVSEEDLDACDDFYENMPLDVRIWHDSLKEADDTENAACGDYSTEMSFFFEIFARKIRDSSPMLTVKLMGFGDRACVLLENESISIGNRSMNAITTFNIIIPYINDAHNSQEVAILE